MRASTAIWLRRVPLMIIKRLVFVKTSRAPTAVPGLVQLSSLAARLITGAVVRRKSARRRPALTPASEARAIDVSRQDVSHDTEYVQAGLGALVANARECRAHACRLFKKTIILKLRDCARARGSGEISGRGSAARARAWAAKITDHSTFTRARTVNAVRCTESSGMTCSRHWHGGFPCPGSD